MVYTLTMLHRWLLILTVFAAALNHSPSAAKQRTDSEIEILSKADAIKLFGLTKEQWLENVRKAVAAGAAMQTGRELSPAVGMIMKTPQGDLLRVDLDYSKGEDRPDFIQVSIGYRPDHAAIFTDQTVRDAITAAQRQMATEFEVHGHSERIKGGLGIFFTIFDKRETSKAYEVHCTEPLPVFTLGKNSNPTKAQKTTLCACIWQSLGKWEREVAEKIAKGRESEVSALHMRAFPSRFGSAVKKCGGMNL